MNAPVVIDPRQEYVDAEYSLIAGLAFENKRIDAVADLLAPEDFCHPFIGHIYGLILSEYSQGRAANLMTLRPLLTGHPQFEEMGGMAFLAPMAMSESLSTPPIETARMLARAAKRRRLVEGLAESIVLGEDEATSFEAIVDAADHAIVTASQGAASATEFTGEDCVYRLMQTFSQPSHGVKCTVIPSIDNLLGPLRPQQFVVLAARPGMGKTAVALSYTLGAAQSGHGVLFVSLEMGGVELGARMVADLSYTGTSGVPLDHILADNPTATTNRAAQNAMHMLADMPLTILDTGKLTVGRLNMVVRRHKRRMAAKGQKLELVVIDYLQLLSPDSQRRSNYEAVSEISMALKAIAKEHEVAVLGLAQLSRDVEKRTDRRPQLSDLRDSGQIEQDADTVLFLLREEYYLRKAEPPLGDPERTNWEHLLSKVENKIQFICAKRRNGREGYAEGEFFTRYQAVRG